MNSFFDFLDSALDVGERAYSISQQIKIADSQARLSELSAELAILQQQNSFSATIGTTLANPIVLATLVGVGGLIVYAIIKK